MTIYPNLIIEALKNVRYPVRKGHRFHGPRRKQTFVSMV